MSFLWECMDGWMIQSMGGNARLLNEPLQTRVKSPTGSALPRRTRGLRVGPGRLLDPGTEDAQKRHRLYSLGRSETLTQLLHQRLGLPLFGDVREQLPGNGSARNVTLKADPVE